MMSKHNQPVGNIRFHQPQHLLRCPGHLDKHAVVDLKETEELKDLAGFGRDSIDTTNTDDEVNFRFSGDVEIARCACSSLQPDFLLLLCQVLLHVGLGPLENDLAFCECCLCDVLSICTDVNSK